MSAFNAVAADGPSCAPLFNPIGGAKPKQERSKRNAWIRLYEHFEQRTKNEQNPFVSAGFNGDKTGLVHREFRKKIGSYDELIKTAEQPEIAYEVYESLTKKLIPNLLDLAKNKNASTNELFSALEATRIMSIIEAKTILPEKIREEQEKKKREEEQKKKQEEQKKKEQEEDDFKWNKNQDKYQPQNKDISSDGEGKKPVIILRTNAHTKQQLYKTQTYDIINSVEMTSNPLIRSTAPKVRPKPDGKAYTRLGVFGAKEISIPIQYGYEPAVGIYSGFRVLERTNDDFVVEILSSGLKEVQIPLIPKPAQSFKSSMGVSVYAQSTGIPKNQWPKEILDFVNTQKGKPILEVAKNLESFLSVDGGYLYFSKGDLIKEAELNRLKQELAQLQTQYATPVAMARIKSFNCDGAAWIGAAILKDFFKIPTRTVGGRTSAGKEKAAIIMGQNGESLSVIRSTDPQHMWLEVWDSGRWVPFDMTPKLNNPDSNSKGKDDLEQHDREDVKDRENPRKGDKDDSKDGKDSKDKSENSQEGGKEAGKKDSDGKESGKQSDKDGKEGKKEDKDGKDKKDGEKDGKDEISKEDQEGTASRGLEQNDSKSKTELKRQYLIYKVFEIIKAWSSELLLMEGNRKGIRDTVFGVLKSFDIFQFSAHQREASEWFKAKESDLFDRKDESLSQWLSSVKILSAQGQLREAYLELKAMENIILAINENRALSAKEESFLIGIQDSLRQFRKVRHKDSVMFDLADRIYRKLPGIVSKQWVREKYGDDVMNIDSLALKNFADDLKTGKLEALVRSALLRDFVDMVLNSEKIPRYKDEKTLFRSIAPKQTQDLVIARSPLELQKMILNPRPGEHIFSRLVRGEQFAIGSRETVRVPDPVSPLERKISVIYFDISGSMSGDKMKVQDSFLMTYVDRALSDMDFAGNPMHEVYILPFGDTVHEGKMRHIKTVEDAKKFTAKMINSNHDAKEGTRIEPTLVHFYNLVAKANAQNATDHRSKLKKANMILVTDGGDTVNMENVVRERKKVPDEVQVNLNFLAVSETNETLIQLAKESNMSTSKPMYRQITAEMISEVMAESQRPTLDKEAFAQSEKIQVPTDITRSLNDLTSKAANFKRDVNIQDIQRKMSEFQLRNLELKDIPNARAPAELLQLQKVLVAVDLPRDVKVRIVYTLIHEYEAYAGRKLDFIIIQEQEAFQALYEWAKK